MQNFFPSFWLGFTGCVGFDVPARLEQMAAQQLVDAGIFQAAFSQNSEAAQAAANAAQAAVTSATLCVSTGTPSKVAPAKGFS